MISDGISIDEILNKVREECPTEFIYSLIPGLQEFEADYQEKMKERRNSSEINNAIPMDHHSKIQNLVLKKAKAFKLRTSINRDWPIFNYATVETPHCRLIIRSSSKLNLDSELIQRHSLPANNPLFEDKFYLKDPIPVIISYTVDKSLNKIYMDLKVIVKSEDDYDVIAVNDSLSRVREQIQGILPPEKVESPIFEEQQKVNIISKKKKA